MRVQCNCIRHTVNPPMMMIISREYGSSSYMKVIRSRSKAEKGSNVKLRLAITSGVTRVGVTRGGNWWVSPYFPWKNWRPFFSHRLWKWWLFPFLAVVSSPLPSSPDSREYGSGLYMKVISSRSGDGSRSGQKSLVVLWNIEPWSLRVSMGFRLWWIVNRMVWPPSLSRDQKWRHVTKCTHSRVVVLRLEGHLVLIYVSIV